LGSGYNKVEDFQSLKTTDRLLEDKLSEKLGLHHALDQQLGGFARYISGN
jgi:hypothetical protein